MINHFRRHDRRETRHERRETLVARLAEAEETLQALRDGEVDALVVRGADGDQVYTLHGAEEPYRNLVEQMREGAVVARAVWRDPVLERAVRSARRRAAGVALEQTHRPLHRRRRPC